MRPTNRLYFTFIFLIFLFVISYFIPFLYDVLLVCFYIFLSLIIIDIFLLFAIGKKSNIKRITTERMSLGDFNTVQYEIKSNFPFPTRVEIIDSLPKQFQARKFSHNVFLKGNDLYNATLKLRPVERGEYFFGPIDLFTTSPIRLIERKSSHIEILPENYTKQQYLSELQKKYRTKELTDFTKVYPSYQQMQKYALITQTNLDHESGNTAIRKIGHSMEFEQIKEYVPGDDIRTINWKATARRGDLMVNHYTEERSQQVFCMLDKGRLMKTAFNGLTLLDYSINATLVLSNTVLKKNDKIGLITFSNITGSLLPADKKPMQINNILELLHKQETSFLESDYERLYINIRRHVKHRSLLVLYTNFENLSGLKRQMHYLRLIAKRHLLLVVFFENSSLEKITEMETKNLEELYFKTIANKFAYEKRLIAKELNKFGILTLLTKPEDLTINSINKYLEIKKKQAL